MADSLQLKNVTAQHERVENLTSSYNYIVSRAVAPTKKLISWTKHLQDQQAFKGYFLLKGGDLQEELKEAGVKYKEHLLQNFFEEEFYETKKIIEIPKTR